jgi:hypothetical protein
MINPIGGISNFIPCTNNFSFRSNPEQQSFGLNFQPNLRPALITDVFQKSTSGGINGSIHSADKAEKLLPFVEIKKFSPGTRDEVRKKTIEKEKNHISSPVTKRTEYNTKQLRSAGVSERDVKKYLTIDGHVNDAGKKILREHGKSYQ